ncbi:MAG: flavodoxin family protein [Thermincolia bacterium]
MAKNLYCLGISCSPRKDGNTSILLDRAMEGARDGGARVETVNLRELCFSPCTGCNGCFEQGQCVLKDDMQDLYQKVLAADRLIIAGPIFSMGLNALGKAFIDRGQRFWAAKYVLKKPVIEKKDRPVRQGIFISAAGSNLPGVFDGAVRVVKYYYLMMETQLVGTYLYPNTDDKGDILKNPAALEEVFKAGLNLIE